MVSGQCPGGSTLFYPPLLRRERSFSSEFSIPGEGVECRKVAVSIELWGKCWLIRWGLIFRMVKCWAGSLGDMGCK